jgi:putative pyruvate formate lyase activating enzyme
MMSSKPGYLTLHRSGELAQRAERAAAHLASCDLCPRRCRVNRATHPGTCRIGRWARVASFHPHFGEEPALTGSRGSGTIFFAGCNLRCQFCQNHNISQKADAPEVDAGQLAAMMVHLQDLGCHNINLVSPSHVVAQILEALQLAAQQGLHLPLVYNSGGYDCLETLHLLEGVVDIYMPDMKYADPRAGQTYSHVADYPAVNRTAVREMRRQVGDLVLDREGIAVRGLLVRHLLLPDNHAGTQQTVRFLARSISVDTYFNLMDQYRPAFRSSEHPEINRPITRQEYSNARSSAEDAGLHRFA